MDDVPGRRRWGTLGGKPPPQSAAQIDRLRFVRDLNLRVSLVMVPGVVVVLLLNPATWVLVVILLGFVLVVADVAYLTLKIGRLNGGSRLPH